MTSPAEQFKANLKAREDASKKHLDEVKETMLKKRTAEQARMNNYSDSLQELIPNLKKWAESGGLSARNIMCGYHDYNTLVSAEALIVSDGAKEIKFIPDGVSRAIKWLGVVAIELPKPVDYHQIYLALDFDEEKQKKVWFYVAFNTQGGGIVIKHPLNEEFFFKLMEEVFLTK